MTTPRWTSGFGYAAGVVVEHEAVRYQCIANHTAGAGNEPDAVADATWQTYWTLLPPSWGNWLFRRVPEWMQLLDVDQNPTYPLQRFLRILGRSFNQTQRDINDFAKLFDPTEVPTAYLEAFAASVGLVLPHAVDEAAQRRLIETACMLYKRKGALKSLEFIATRYLGRTITITNEDWAAHTYTVDYGDLSDLDLDQQATFLDELNRILTLYQPAGLNVSTPTPPVISPALNDVGDLNDDFLVAPY